MKGQCRQTIWSSSNTRYPMYIFDCIYIYTQNVLPDEEEPFTNIELPISGSLKIRGCPVITA